jgi:hypothetical protein
VWFDEGMVLIWIGARIASTMFAYIADEENSRKLWGGLLDRYRKRAKEKIDKLLFKVAELQDGLIGKCEQCKGFGVMGDDGQYDCWECGGTGASNFERFKYQARRILIEAERNTRKVLSTIEDARKIVDAKPSSILRKHYPSNILDKARCLFDPRLILIGVTALVADVQAVGRDGQLELAFPNTTDEANDFLRRGKYFTKDCKKD